MGEPLHVGLKVRFARKRTAVLWQSQNENPAQVRVRAGSREPSRKVVRRDCWRAPLGKHMGAPEVPHGTSGTGSPQDTRSWKPAALLLTGRHAQAPAVLDHSRTLPQGDGRAGPTFTGC